MPWGYNRKVVHTATTSQLFLIVIIQDGNGNLSLKEFKKLIRPALDHIFVCEGDEEFEGIQIGRKILESQNLTKRCLSSSEHVAQICRWQNLPMHQVGGGSDPAKKCQISTGLTRTSLAF